MFTETGHTADTYTIASNDTDSSSTRPSGTKTRRFKSRAKTAPVALPRFPSLDVVTRIKAQFFDNSNLQAVQGRSRYALRIDALEDGQAFNDDVHWWRTVQLIRPDTVSNWVLRQHQDGVLTDEMTVPYGDAIELAGNMEKAGDTVWMGHIYTPPGTTYIIGQFVLARMTKDGEFSVTLYVDGEQIDFEAFRPQKKENCHYKAAKLWCVVEAGDDA